MANEEKKMYVTEIRKGIYLMDEAHEATGYLVVGEERACMIDTMNAYTNLREEVKKLTDKPVYVVNTHGHGDHIFGNVYFDEAYIDPADRGIVRMFLESPDYVKLAEEKGWKMPLYKEIHEGDKLDLGGRTLEIYSLPGHTPGGILLLLKEDRVLFSGDSINHHLWMQLPGCLPLHEYVKKLDRIMFLEEKADIVVHGHAGETGMTSPCCAVCGTASRKSATGRRKTTSRTNGSAGRTCSTPTPAKAGSITPRTKA